MPTTPTDAGDAAMDEPGDAPALSDWVIKFRPLATLYLKANDPALVLRELERLGPLEVALEQADLPLLDDLDPEGAYLAWTLTLRTAACEADIRETFEFVEGDCDLEITAPWAHPPVSPRSAGRRTRRRSADVELDVMALIQRAQAEVAPRRRPLKIPSRPPPAAGSRARRPARPPSLRQPRAAVRRRPAKAADATAAAAPVHDHHPRRSRPGRPADQPGRRTGDQPGHAVPAGDRGRPGPLVQRGARP